MQDGTTGSNSQVVPLPTLSGFARSALLNAILRTHVGVRDPRPLAAFGVRSLVGANFLE